MMCWTQAVIYLGSPLEYPFRAKGYGLINKHIDMCVKQIYSIKCDCILTVYRFGWVWCLGLGLAECRAQGNHATISLLRKYLGHPTAGSGSVRTGNMCPSD